MRWVRLACVAMLGSGLLAACGGGNEAPSEPSSVPSAAPPASSPTPGGVVPFQISDPSPTVDPIEADTIEASIFSGDYPGHVIAAFGSIWVSNHHSNSVSRIDPETDEVVERINVGLQPGGLLAAAGSVWVTNCGANTVSRIDPATNDSVPFETGDGLTCGTPAFAGGLVWVGQCDEGITTGLDPKTGTVRRTIEAAGMPAGDGGDLWLSGDDGLVRFDPEAGRELAEVSLGSGTIASWMSFTDDRLWFGYADGPTGDGKVAAIDLATSHAETVGDVGSVPDAPVVDDGVVWVMSLFDETMSMIDASAQRVVDTTDLPPVAAGQAAVAFGSIWLPDTESGYVYRVELPS
jgi:YVTN family beta-propeller protein